MILKKNKFTAMALILGLTSISAVPAMAENGQVAQDCLIFAQCEEAINVRQEPSADAKVVATLENNDYAEILSHQDGWYEIFSGDVYGFVKDDYFATGSQAAQIASEVAYNVAEVYAEELNIREQPNDDAAVVTVAHKGDEIEVVSYEGDWMKVALGDDVYGYVNAYYVGYKTYYPSGDYISEEAEEGSEEKETEAKKEETADTADQAAAEETYTQEETYAQQADYTQETYTDTTAYTDTTYTDTTYTDTSAYTYTETTYTEAPVYTDTTYTDTTYTDTTYTQTEAVYTAPETEAYVAETPAETVPDTSYAESSSAGQKIVDDAMQYLGSDYVWGGNDPSTGVDCSGLTSYVLNQNGISVARTAADQAAGGTSVDVSDVQAGDLLFYSDGSGISHVAIYAGDGKIVHSADESTGVIVSDANYDTPVAAARYW